MLMLLAVAVSSHNTAGGANKRARSELSIPETVVGTPRPISNKDLIMLRDIDTLAVSPDGKYVAFQIRQAVLETNSYRIAWFVAPTDHPGRAVNVGDAGEPQLLTFADGTTEGEFSPKPAQWSPDSQWIAYIVKTNGSFQLWRSRRDGASQEQLTYNAADVRGFSWMPDGQKLYVIINRQTRDEIKREEMQESAKGYLLDARFSPSTSQTKPYYKPTGTAPTKRGITWLEVPEWGSDAELWVYDVLERVERTSTHPEYESFVHTRQNGNLQYKRTVDRVQFPGEALVAFAPNQRFVGWLDMANTDDRSAWPDLTVFAAKEHNGASTIECKHDACTGRINGLWWSEDSKDLYFDRGEGVNRSSHGLYAWSVENNTLRKILSTNDFLWKCSRANASLVCLHESPTTPRRMLAIHLSDGSTETLVDPNPEYRNIRLGPAERLEWKNEFGYAVFGHLIRPLNYTSGKAYPLVIVTYRSTGFLRGGTGDEYPEQVLARNGMMVLSLDIPDLFDYLSVGQDLHEFEKASYGDLLEFRSMQSALESGIQLVEKKGDIDSSRVAVTGLSTGSSIVYYALLDPGRHYAAAITSSPPPDPMTFYVMPEGYRTNAIPGFGFPDGQNGKFWNQLSPAVHIDKLHTPLLMNISDSELIMSMQIVSTMTEYHKPFEAYVYPGEEHVKRCPMHRYAIYQRNVDWLNFWLNGEEDRDPAKVEQYKRWRELRTMQEKNEKKAVTADPRASRPLAPAGAFYRKRQIKSWLGQFSYSCRHQKQRIGASETRSHPYHRLPVRLASCAHSRDSAYSKTSKRVWRHTVHSKTPS
jgi:dipeptidyl aminopeptidase/acylaminoacyl peptidase